MKLSRVTGELSQTDRQNVLSLIQEDKIERTERINGCDYLIKNIMGCYFSVKIEKSNNSVFGCRKSERNYTFRIK